MDFRQAHRAIKQGDLTLLRRSIPSSLSADASNQFGWTLLMLAAIEGNTAIGELLAANGADVNALNDFGESALTLAACAGHLPFVQFLKRSGATVSGLQPHGHDLPAWLRSASGLPDEKIAAILEAVGSL